MWDYQLNVDVTGDDEFMRRDSNERKKERKELKSWRGRMTKEGSRC